MPGIVKAPLGHAPNQRHLPALETRTDRTTRARRLALATAATGLAVSAGLALAQPLAPMLGTVFGL